MHEQSSIATRQTGEGKTEDTHKSGTRPAQGSHGEGQGEEVAEEWRPVVGYEGLYEVSNMGRVKSITRICKSGPGKRVQIGRILSPSATGKTAKKGAGYLAVKVSVDGDQKLLRLHRAVAEAFIPNPLSMPQVNHKDTVTFNNRASNLEWTDNAGNIRHAAANGLLKTSRGEDCVTHKITEQEAREIKTSTLSTKELVKVYSIGKSQILRIKNNQSWAHI